MRRYTLFILIIVIGLCLCEVPNGFVVNPKDGHAYKLMYHAQNWIAARDSCADIGAKLAVPKSKEQFAFIQRIVRSMQFGNVVGSKFKLLVWLGISNIDNFKMWKNVDGENIEDTGYHTWAGKYNGLHSEDPREPHCVGVDASNAGLRDWWCHRAQAYICEIPAHTSP